MAFIEDFLFMFLIIYLVYIIFVNRTKKDFSKLKASDPIVIFVLKYELNVSKINYLLLINLLSIINSFIIAFTATIITHIDSIIWSIIVCFVLLFVLMYSLYELLGRYFKKSESKNKVVKKKKKSKKSEEDK